MMPCDFRYVPKKRAVAASAMSTILDLYQGLVAEIAIIVVCLIK